MLKWEGHLIMQVFKMNDATLERFTELDVFT